MSFVSKEKTAPGTWKVSAKIAAADFAKQLDETAKTELEKITLPGFRKGKAPRAMVEKRFGADVFHEEAVNAVLPGAVSAALEGAELTPLFRPDGLDVGEISKDEDIAFSFSVVTAPEVAVGEYKGLAVAVPAAEVAPADIDERIHELQHRNARQISVEGRAAQDGDVAVIDFKGLLEGTAFEGGTAEEHELKLGSGQFIPGFEEQVTGHLPGESFEVHVTFPEEYHAEELAGKPVVFEVTLRALKAEELPEADDDFAQEVGEDYNTMDDLRAGIAKELTEGKARAADEAFNHAVQDQLAQLTEGEIAEEIFARRTQQNVELFLERIRIDLEQYLNIIGETEEAFRARIRAQSEGQVKLELALEKIAALEEIAPADEEIEAEYQRLADEYGVPLARAKFAVPSEEIVKDLSRAKALELVKAAAVKTEQAADEEAEEA